eukprot:gene5648-6230_t
MFRKRQPLPTKQSFLRATDESFYYGDEDEEEEDYPEGPQEPVTNGKGPARRSVKKKKKESFHDIPHLESNLSDPSSSQYDLTVSLTPLKEVEEQRRSRRLSGVMQPITDLPQGVVVPKEPSFHAEFEESRDLNHSASHSSDPFDQLSSLDFQELSHTFDVNAVLQLVDMGFPLPHIRIALESCEGRVQDAIVFCLEHSNEDFAALLQQRQPVSNSQSLPPQPPSASSTQMPSTAADCGRPSNADQSRSVMVSAIPPQNPNYVDEDMLHNYYLGDDMSNSCATLPYYHSPVPDHPSQNAFMEEGGQVGAIISDDSDGNDDRSNTTDVPAVSLLPRTVDSFICRALAGRVNETHSAADSDDEVAVEDVNLDDDILSAARSAHSLLPAARDPEGLDAPAGIDPARSLAISSVSSSGWGNEIRFSQDFPERDLEERMMEVSASLDPQESQVALAPAACSNSLDDSSDAVPAVDSEISYLSDSEDGIGEIGQEIAPAEEDIDNDESSPNVVAISPNEVQNVERQEGDLVDVPVADFPAFSQDLVMEPAVVEGINLTEEEDSSEQLESDDQAIVSPTVQTAEEVENAPLSAADDNPETTQPSSEHAIISPSTLQNAVTQVENEVDTPAPIEDNPQSVEPSVSHSIAVAAIVERPLETASQPENAAVVTSSAAPVGASVVSAATSVASNIRDINVVDVVARNGVIVAHREQTAPTTAPSSRRGSRRNRATPPPAATSTSAAPSSQTAPSPTERSPSATPTPASADGDRTGTERPAQQRFVGSAAWFTYVTTSISFEFRREFLPYQIMQQNGNGQWRGKITLRQPHLHRNEVSPQGKRPDQILTGPCISRSICMDLCQSLTPPQWESKSTTRHCTLCRKSLATLFGTKGHHCRNCGFLFCDECSDKIWPSMMLPVTYCHQENIVRVCHLCHLLMEEFVTALKKGDWDMAMAVYSSGNVNLHQPLSFYHDRAFPIHCAVRGGNLDIVKWLLEVKKCSLVDHQNGEPLRTASGLSVLAVAALEGHESIIRYLVLTRSVPVDHIVDPMILQRALHVILGVNGPWPVPYIDEVEEEEIANNGTIKRSWKKKKNQPVYYHTSMDSLLFGESSKSILELYHLNQEITQGEITGGKVTKGIRPRKCCPTAINMAAQFLSEVRLYSLSSPDAEAANSPEMRR